MKPITVITIAPFLLTCGLSVGACFGPTISEGVFCGEGDSCPAGMQCDPLDGRCRFELLPAGENLRIFPDLVEFGPVVQGNSSSPSTFTVVNLGLDSSNPLEISARETEHFIITDIDCQGAVLEREGSCSFTGTFKPGATGPQDTTLTVTDSANTALSLVKGTGLALSDLRMQPSNHDFGTMLVGTASGTQIFVVRNAGTDSIGALDVEMNPPGVFTLDNDSCTGAVLEENQTCMLEVSYTPLIGGTPVSSVVVSGTQEESTSSSVNGAGTSVIIVDQTGASGGSVVSSPTGIDCGSDCEHEFAVDEVTLTALPGDGASFERWLGAGSCTTATTCKITTNSEEFKVTAEWSSCSGSEFLRCDDEHTAVYCSNNADGETSEDCPFTCNPDLGRCNQCIPGGFSCVGNTVVSCNDNGQIIGMTSCQLPSTCQGGTCVFLMDGGTTIPKDGGN